MTAHPRPRCHRFAGGRRTTVVLAAAFAIASLATVSAHIVRGLTYPTLALAFVSSPSANLDAPIKVMWESEDTGLRVACFYTANTSPPSADPQWPRITAVGFELPDKRAGFSLMEPLNGEWELVEGANAVLPGHGAVTVDFAIIARVNPVGFSPGRPRDPLGIPPGQATGRGNGTRFCVSGPFPDGMTIEQMINGVVVRFHQVQPQGLASDIGIWDSPLRTVPLYP
ncbi:MAG TPA: hypothetical protein VMO26_00700 [Vicinamibacterales bacterium]|nr:hypothetical protein [Vicinamibacterales bacterium]